MTAFISDVYQRHLNIHRIDITYEIKGLNNKFLDISFKSNFLDAKVKCLFANRFRKLSEEGQSKSK